MLSIAEAIVIVDRETPSCGAESILLSEAVGRILSEDIVADSDMPPFDRSQMDGYAVIAADTKKGSAELRIVGESAAGRGWNGVLRTGEAVRIMTGARLPRGADSIQKIELTQETADTVVILEPTEKGRFIVVGGSEIKSGDKLFSAGEQICSRMIAALAAFGKSRIRVTKRPRVLIMATGSEIVDVSKKPGPDQIRNSNSPMLRAFAENCGALAHELPIAGDDLPTLKRLILKSLEMNDGERTSGNKRGDGPDILILTGGVSVGKYDLTKAALEALGAEIFFEKLRLKPGKPAVFARLNHTLIFGLPGNPVSAAVVFHLLVRKAILQMQAANETNARSGFAALSDSAKGTKERDSYLPAAMSTDANGRLIATPIPWHGSSDFIGFARAHALIVVPSGENRHAGDICKIVFLD